jgi:ADP-ribosylglycohydrolase
MNGTTNKRERSAIMHDALNLHELLADELVQRRQSGSEISAALAARVGAAAADPGTPITEVASLYDEVEKAPLRPSWHYDEPTALDEILEQAPGAAISAPVLGAEYADRALAAWLGRCAGCNLGKPVEGHGWDRYKLKHYLEEAGAFPLEDYIPVHEPLPEGCTLHPSWAVATRGRVHGMARDDDLDYTMLGLRALEKYGRGYTSADVAQEWLGGMPFHMVYTAERVAYRNLVQGLQPPVTATVHNPYREWIGAMIRADIFGYASPGDPQGAAVLSYQDAALSHTANGIYGEMWAAALVAAAFASSSAREALDQANPTVPARSRLAESLQLTMSAFDSGGSWESAMEAMEKRLEGYSWVHTINNAEVVTAALLWGEGDFSRTIGLAVEAGLDTDCTGATAGSVFGALHGTGKLPEHWTGPLEDTMHSAIFGFEGSSISGLAARTVGLARHLAA